MAAAPNETAADQIRVTFDKKEKALENEIDHRPLEMHLEMEVHYNVSAAALALAHRTRTRPPTPSLPPLRLTPFRCLRSSSPSEQRARCGPDRPHTQRTCGDRSAKNPSPLLSLSLSLSSS